MNNELKNYCKELQGLTEEEKVLRDLYLRKLRKGKIQGPCTGYPSIDKPNLQYYEEEHIMAPLPHMTIAEYIEHQNKNNLDNIAIEGPDGTYTYGELKKTYHQFASALASLGVKKSDKSLTMLTPTALEAIVIYGSNLIGAITTGVPEFSTPSEVCDSINKIGVKTLFTADFLLTEEMESAIYQNTNIEHIVYLDFGMKRVHNSNTISFKDFMNMGKDKEIPDNKVTPEDIVYISQTGGSTGKPKAVKINSNSFNIAAHQYINSKLDYSRGDRWVRMWSLFSASATVSNCHLPLSVGMHNILENFPYKNINDFEDIMLRDKPNHLMAIPQIVEVLKASKKLTPEDLANVKTVGVGGMAITSTFEQDIQEFFDLYNINTYLGYGWGCTENSTSAAMRSSFETTEIGFVGSPLVKTVVAVFDPITGEELPYGAEGELCINSYTIMEGYLNDDKLTNEVVRIHPDGSKWLHTGDLGFINNRGLVKVTGRMTRTIFTVSEKLYPTTMENTLAKIPGIKDIAICKMPDPENPGFDTPICYFVPEDVSAMEEIKIALSQVCDSIYAPLSRPRFIIGKEALPLNNVGKPNILLLEKEILESLPSEQRVLRK